MKYKHSRKEMFKFIEKKWRQVDVDPVKRCSDYGNILGKLLCEGNMLFEKAEWPQEEDEFWYIGIHLEPMVSSRNHLLSEALKEVGNIFRTKKEAIKARNKIREVLND